MITAAEIAGEIKTAFAPGTILTEDFNPLGFSDVSDLLGWDAPDNLWAWARSINEHLTEHAVVTSSESKLLCPDCAAADIAPPRMVIAHVANLSPKPKMWFCEFCEQDLCGHPVTVLEVDHRKVDYIAAFYGANREAGR